MGAHVAVVTGGAQGIGLCTAAALAHGGAQVAVVDLNQVAAQDAATRLSRDTDGRVRAWTADVCDPLSIDNAFRGIEDVYGHPDILVNNAGIITPEFLPAERVDVDAFDRMLDVHLRGSFVCSARALPAMKQYGYGRIVMISSLVGPLGFPGRLAYATAKSGIEGMTRSLAVEGGPHGITVNAVAPGWIRTPLVAERLANGSLDQSRLLDRTALGRWGEPGDVAQVITALVSPAFDYVTGAVVPVDGGYAARGDSSQPSARDKAL